MNVANISSQKDLTQRARDARHVKVTSRVVGMRAILPLPSSPAFYALTRDYTTLDARCTNYKTFPIQHCISLTSCITQGSAQHIVSDGSTFEDHPGISMDKQLVGRGKSVLQHIMNE